MSLKIEQQRKEKVIRWIKRIGFWGFIFFLVKGLCWLALGYWLLK
ncbi:alanyl-tRNA synthetase [Chitinophaga pinensis]|uniref:Alanyl-tRNA synthetase n=1 Tax=Chitinophaga pinensis TaxID=79329 RepID=A0A5C6LW78_9BACT|nr:alanyl-tRNA synthetase [Chitinophaga pinensis]